MTSDILLWGYAVSMAIFFIWSVIIIDEDTPLMGAFFGCLITATIWPAVFLFWVGIKLRELKG